MPQLDPVVLALDDEQDIVDTICAIGVRAGFRAVSSTSAARFRELIETERPDVIVLDLQMPGQDGVATLRYLADVKVAAKIFLVTGMDERTIASAEQYGLRRGLQVVGTLQKPFDPDELLIRLRDYHRSSGRPARAVGRSLRDRLRSPGIRLMGNDLWG